MAACEICRENGVKYKCPVCVIRYCSVPCYKRHKEHDCHTVQLEENCKVQERVESGDFGLVREEGELSSSESDFSDDDCENGVESATLQCLGLSAEVQNLLANPHLCDMLQHVDQSSDPEKALGDALDIPIFTEFADACLSFCSSTKN